MAHSIGIAISLLGAVVLIGRGDLGDLLALAMNRGDGRPQASHGRAIGFNVVAL